MTYNAIQGITSRPMEQVKFLVQQNAIEPMCRLLNCKDVQVGNMLAINSFIVMIINNGIGDTSDIGWAI